MTCYCERCSTTPKPTYTEKFKMECLAREVAKLGYDGRKKCYEDLKLRISKEFTERLAKEVDRQILDMKNGSLF